MFDRQSVKIFSLSAENELHPGLDCLSPNNFQILAFQHFAEHPTSLRRHTGPCTPFTNWLIEPSYHPLPMCAQFVSFNSYRNSRVETKLPLFPLFINRGKNSGLFFIFRWFFCERGNGNKDSKVDPESQKPCEHIDLASRADENKRESPGEVRTQF